MLKIKLAEDTVQQIKDICAENGNKEGELIKVFGRVAPTQVVDIIKEYREECASGENAKTA